MTRIFRLILWYVVGLVLGGVSVASYAAVTCANGVCTQPATTTNTGTYSYQSVCYASGNAICSSFFPTIAPNFKQYDATYQVLDCQGSEVRWLNSVGAGCVAYTCPSGWTQNGATCSKPDCPPDQYMTEGGTCANKCQAGKFPGWASGNSVQGAVGGSGEAPATVCAQNGNFWCSTNLSFSMTGGGQWWSGTMGNMTGAACDPGAGGIQGDGSAAVPSSDPSDLPSDPSRISGPAAQCVEAGQEYGEVNGVVVCTSPGPNTTVKSESKSTSTTTTNGGTPTTTTTTKSTSCQGEECTTTTTTISAGVTTVNTSTAPKADYCAENSQDKACGGQGNEQGDYCKSNPGSVSCMKAGDPQDGDPLGTKTLGVSVITPVSITTNMSCPQPISLPKGWGQISYEPVCNLADLIRPFVLIFAWLGAGLIVIGGVRSDG